MKPIDRITPIDQIEWDDDKCQHCYRPVTPWGWLCQLYDEHNPLHNINAYAAIHCTNKDWAKCPLNEGHHEIKSEAAIRLVQEKFFDLDSLERVRKLWEIRNDIDDTETAYQALRNGGKEKKDEKPSKGCNVDMIANIKEEFEESLDVLSAHRLFSYDTETEQRKNLPVSVALEIARRFGGTDESHHKSWVIDQMVRALTGSTNTMENEQYKQVTGEDWDKGIAP